MYDSRNKLSSMVANDVRDHFGDLVYSTVPRNARVGAPSLASRFLPDLKARLTGLCGTGRRTSAPGGKGPAQPGQTNPRPEDAMAKQPEKEAAKKAARKTVTASTATKSAAKKS